MSPNYEQPLREGPLLLWAGGARLGLKAAEGSGKPCFLSCSAAPCSPASAERAPPHSRQPRSDSQIGRKERKLEPKDDKRVCREDPVPAAPLYTRSSVLSRPRHTRPDSRERTGPVENTVVSRNSSIFVKPNQLFKTH